MNYNLAKQLKDAGFPQLGSSHEWYDPERQLHINPIAVVINDWVSILTLSELIEACGDFALDKHRDAPCEGELSDEFTYEASTDKLSFISDTPEEAVANLWLSLNHAKMEVNKEIVDNYK